MAHDTSDPRPPAPGSRIIPVDFAERLGLPAPERQGELFADLPDAAPEEQDNPAVFVHPAIDRQLTAAVGKLPDAAWRIARGLATFLRPRKDGSFSGYPGKQSLAKRAGVSLKTVKRHLAGAVTYFGVRVEERRGRPNLYIWTPAEIAEGGTASPHPQQSTRGLPVPPRGDSQSPGPGDSQSPRTGVVLGHGPAGTAASAPDAPPPLPEAGPVARRVWRSPEARSILTGAGIPCASGLQHVLDSSSLPATLEALAAWLAHVELQQGRLRPWMALQRVLGHLPGPAPDPRRLDELRAVLEAVPDPGAGSRETGVGEEDSEVG